jgi:hypothetical protein
VNVAKLGTATTVNLFLGEKREREKRERKRERIKREREKNKTCLGRFQDCVRGNSYY